MNEVKFYFVWDGSMSWHKMAVLLKTQLTTSDKKSLVIKQGFKAIPVSVLFWIMLNHVKSFDECSDDEDYELYFMDGTHVGQNHVTYNHVPSQQKDPKKQQQQQLQP